MEIELKKCNVSWTTNKSSRKNVFQLNTPSGLQILFQSDDKEGAKSWYEEIDKRCDHVDPSTVEVSNTNDKKSEFVLHCVNPFFMNRNWSRLLKLY